MNAGDIISMSIFADPSDVNPYVSRCYAPLTRIQQTSLFMRYYNNRDGFFFNDENMAFTANDLSEPQYLSRTLVNGHILLLIATPLANIVQCEQVLGCVSETLDCYIRSGNLVSVSQVPGLANDDSPSSMGLEPLRYISVLDEAVQASFPASADHMPDSTTLRIRVEMYSEHEKKEEEERAEKLREQQARMEAEKRAAERLSDQNTGIVTKGLSKLGALFGLRSAKPTTSFSTPTNPQYAGLGSSALTEEQKEAMRKSGSRENSEYMETSAAKSRERAAMQNDKYAGFGSSSFASSSVTTQTASESPKDETGDKNNKYAGFGSASAKTSAKIPDGTIADEDQDANTTDTSTKKPTIASPGGVDEMQPSKKAPVKIIPKVLVHGNKEKISAVKIVKTKGVTF